MLTDHLILSNEYRDSVSLMQIAAQVRDLDGVEDAAVIMMTAANLALLDGVGLSVGDVDARPSDLLIVVVAADRDTLDAAFQLAHAALEEEPDTSADGGPREEPVRSIEMALGRSAADLVVISTPGEFAAYEAEKALRLGCNVMLFSDGIDIDEERRLKLLADERGLLVMGPDCGTAIIGGVPLAFANEVRPGPIGVVGASGTGIQAVVCAIDNLGGGITHAFGTGGHDLHERVGGLSMLRGISLLERDAHTEVIVLVSKPPSPAIATRVIDAATATGKPVVVCFLGADASSLPDTVHAAGTLEEAAAIAVRLAGGGDVEVPRKPDELDVALAPSQRFVRGLYSGGTLCFEATMVLSRGLPLASNTPIPPALDLDDPWTSSGHTLVDLGDDVFTRGRPHPMIDHTIRNERLLQEARDPQTAVVLLDVVLGHGSHEDPAAAMAPAVAQAREIAAGAGRALPIVGVLVGTDTDPQGLERQRAALHELGVTVHVSHRTALDDVAALVNSIEGEHR